MSVNFKSNRINTLTQAMNATEYNTFGIKKIPSEEMIIFVLNLC